MRKFAAVLLSLALVLGLSGCGDLGHAESTFTQPHQSRPPIDPDDEELILSARNAQGIYDAVIALIGIGAERGVIRMYEYEGELEDDLAAAVLTASSQTPLGAYCLYYIDYSLVTAPGGREANVSLMYRHSPEDAEKIIECGDTRQLTEEIYRAMSARETVLTVYATDESVDESAISRAVESVYYDHPGQILYIPTYTVTAYPEAGEIRILEVVLTYPYATSTVESRRRSLDSRTDLIISGLQGESDRELIEAAAEYISENVVFDESVLPSNDLARRYNAMTAYGALVQGRAAGEGFAMAMKVLCDELGIECLVVRGTVEGKEHSWNMVCLENGVYYHVDIARSLVDGPIFWNDGQHSHAGYEWDAQLYPACDGPSLYGPEYDVPPEDDDGQDEPDEQPDEPDEPAEPDEPDEPDGPNTPGDPDTQEGGAGQPGPQAPPEGDTEHIDIFWGLGLTNRNGTYII